MTKKLTKKQVEALSCIRFVPNSASPWDFGSTTISVLRNRGLIEQVTTRGTRKYVITEAGRAALIAEGA